MKSKSLFPVLLPHMKSIRSGGARLDVISTFVLLAVLTPVAPAFAQYTTATGSPTFATTLPVEMGFTDVSNGNLHIEIPLASFPQRGNLSYNARLVYDSLIWKIVGTAWSPTNVPDPMGKAPNSMGGWRLVTGGEVGTVTHFITRVGCDSQPITWRTAYGPFTWTAPDGTAHMFPVSTMRDTTVCQEDVKSSTAMADDSSGYSMSVTNYTSATIYAPDGTQVYPTVMDTNGNYFSTDGSGNIIDTLERTPVTVTTNGNTITYAVLNAQGTRTNITVTTTTVSANTSFGQGGVTECQCTVTAIQSIAFDDNTSYSFTYDSGSGSGHFAELASMTLRTGATVSYGYTTFVDGAGNSSRWLSSKAVGSNSWSYTPQAQSITSQQVTVGEPTGDRLIYAFSLNNGAWVNGVTYVDATKGTLLYLTNTWDTSQSCPETGCAGSAYIRILTTQTQIANGPSKTVTYQYASPSTGQVTEIDESDYSSGTPPILRKTLISYASLTNTVSKPLQVTIEDGSNNTVSQGTYTYDEPQYLTATSGIVQHGAPASSRGNVTTISRWVSGSATPLASHTNYYDTGVPFQTIDPNTSPTQYSYMCQAAYPSSIAAPLSLTTSLNWDCNTGLLISTTDANNQVTTYQYDTEGRGTEIDYPDRGQKKAAYNLSANPPNIVDSTKIDSLNHQFISTTLLDGLGRPYQSQINSDPLGVDYVDTTYDGLGRRSTVGNPYRSTGDPTYGITTTTYDVLGRITNVKNQDNSFSTADYSQFPVVTVTDEAGKVRKTQVDALGRLIKVWEDPNGLNYETDYQYDAPGNLLRVDQKGSSPSDSTQWRTRTFTYDSLSRSLCVSQPEVGGSVTCPTPDSGTYTTGTIRYSYDGNGNVLTRQAPAPNQSGSASVTTTYAYDALHRLTSQTYSDGTTPSANFTYDTADTGWGISFTNPIGRMVEAYTLPWVSGEIFGYDAMGRVVMNHQWVPAAGTANDSQFNLDYTYDLLGNMTSYTTGVGVTFTQSFDSAGRFTQLTSSLSDTQHPGTLATVDSTSGYYATGDLHKIAYGNSLTESPAFNVRLQPCRTNLNLSGGTLLTCGDAAPAGTVQDFTYGFNAGASDNGSLTSFSASGAQVFNRSYGYDSLNRLKSMSAPGDSCTGLTWSLDAWGNRTDQNNAGGTCNTFHQQANSQNRLPSPYQYDAAGNLINDGCHTFTYDAENRVITVTPVGVCTGSATYTYDALGRRMHKVYGSTYIDELYDLSGNVVTEFDNQCGLVGCWARSYIYLSGQRVAEYGDSTTYFAHRDHLGSTHLMTAAGPSTRIQSTGGTSSTKYYYDLGMSVNGTVYTVSAWIKNQGTAPVQIGGNLGTGVTVAPGVTQFVSFSTTGNAVSDIQFLVNTQNAGDPIDVLAYWPSVSSGGGNLIPVANQNFSGWNTYQGSSVAVTQGQTPIIVDSMDYLPYGELIAGGTRSTHKFTGHERDSESNLDHTWFRQYSSAQGRWTTPDPFLGSMDLVNPQSLNSYGYVLNSPCGFYDQFGSDICYLSIHINNQAGLTEDQLSQIQVRINTIYGATPGANDEIAVAFTSGKGDYSLTFTPGNPGATVGETPHFFGWYFTPKVFTAATLNAYQANYLIGTGSTAAHELVHRITHIGDLPYAGTANLMNVDSAMKQSDELARQVAADDVNPIVGGFDLLSQSQAAQLYKQCRKLHPSSGGGGGGSGSGYSFDGLAWGYWSGGYWARGQAGDGDIWISWGSWGWWPTSHPHILHGY